MSKLKTALHVMLGHFLSVLADEQQFQFLYFLEIRPQRSTFVWEFQTNEPDGVLNECVGVKT